MMPKDRWAALTGPLTMAIGLLWMLAAVGEFVLLAGLGSPDSFWDMFWLFPVGLSFGLMIPAFSLTRRRYQLAANGIGRLGLTLSVAGCAAMASFVLISIVAGALGIEQDAWADTVIAACFATLMAGHVLFGLNALQSRLLPRWNAMPLLVAMPSILLSVPSLLIDRSTPNQFELTLVTTYLRFALTGAGWVLLGLAMMDTGREPQPAAAT
jgi:hypothetical protein